MIVLLCLPLGGLARAEWFETTSKLERYWTAKAREVCFSTSHNTVQNLGFVSSLTCEERLINHYKLGLKSIEVQIKQVL